MRDVYRNYEVIENAILYQQVFFPTLASLFTKMVAFVLFTAIMAVSLSVNIYVFSWVVTNFNLLL